MGVADQQGEEANDVVPLGAPGSSGPSGRALVGDGDTPSVEDCFVSRAANRSHQQRPTGTVFGIVAVPDENTRPP